MYGPSLFTDEVLRSVDRELISYLQTDKLDIFAQPLPLEMDIRQLDVNNPAEYVFHFEIGMKPDFTLTDLGAAPITRYVVTVTDEMIDNEITRLQNRYGNMKDQDSVNTEENVLNVTFTQTDADGNESEDSLKKDNSLLVKYFSGDFRKNLMGKKAGDFLTTQLPAAFDEKERDWVIEDLGLKDDQRVNDKYFKITITKVGLLEKRELNEEFFTQLYPSKETPGTSDVKSEADFRNKIREEIQVYWNNQARNQIHDQVFHQLVDHTDIKFPEGFLKKWVKTQSDSSDKENTPKTDEQVEQEFPVFINQLKWTLITDKIVQENGIQVNPDEIRSFAKHQLFSYMSGANMSDDQPWVKDYVEKMMKDRKFVEDAHTRIQAQKIFEWAETKVKPTDKDISAEEFTGMVEAHQHHHH
jgi:trigger factor